MTEEEKIDIAYQEASGHYLTEQFSFEEFQDIKVADFVTENYEYADYDMVREQIVQMADRLIAAYEDDS